MFTISSPAKCFSNRKSCHLLQRNPDTQNSSQPSDNTNMGCCVYTWGVGVWVCLPHRKGFVNLIQPAGTGREERQKWDVFCLLFKNQILNFQGSFILTAYSKGVFWDFPHTPSPHMPTTSPPSTSPSRYCLCYNWWTCTDASSSWSLWFTVGLLLMHILWVWTNT